MSGPPQTPLGELTALPRPLSWIQGALLLRRRVGKGGKGKGGEKGGKEKGGKGSEFGFPNRHHPAPQKKS